MTSLFRKFTWWLQRRRKEDELREELQFHLAEEADERHADGLSEDQARWAARRDLGNVTLAAGRHAHAVVVDPARAAGAGRPLRPADDVQEPPVHRPGGTVARARHRREHCDLQLHGLDPVALAAGVGSGVAGGGEVAQQTVHQRAQRVRVRAALDRRQHLPRPRGHHGGIFPFPAFERLQEASAPVLSSLFAYHPAGNVNVMIKGEAELAKGGVRLRRLLSRAGGVAGRGPSDPRRRRSCRRATGRGDQHGLQPAAFRRRRRGDRSADSDQQRGVHRDRRDAVRVLRRRSRRGARRLSSDARQSAVRPGGRARHSSTRTTTGSR